MNARITKIAVATLLMAVLSGCQLTPVDPAEDPVLIKLAELERRLQSIERVVQNQSLVDLTQQVNSVERRGDELQGRVEELEYNTDNAVQRQRQLYVDLDTRLQQLETSVRAASTAGRNTTQSRSADQLPVPGGTDRDNYQAAFELLKDQSYEAAGAAFKQFLATYPDSELADNAQYWLAEAHYVTQQFEQALRDFETVIRSFPESRKIPDALLKIGYCNYELQRFDEARQSLERVQSDFGDTTAARLAGQRLERMDEEGV